MKILVLKEDNNFNEGINFSGFKSKLSKIKGLKVGRLLSLIYQLYKQAKNNEKFNLHKALVQAKKESNIKDNYELSEGVVQDIIGTTIFLKVIQFLYNCLMTASVSSGIDLTQAELTSEFTTMTTTSTTQVISEVLPYVGIMFGATAGLIGLISLFKSILNK